MIIEIDFNKKYSGTLSGLLYLLFTKPKLIKSIKRGNKLIYQRK